MENTFFYAVYRGKTTGVFNTWKECQEQTKGFSKPVFRKFATYEDALAFSKGGNFKKNTNEKESVTKAVKARKRIRMSDDDTEERPHAISKVHDIMVAEKCDPKRDSPTKVVYTDGASSNNGKANAKAGYGVYWGDNDPRNVSVRLSGDRQTNQRAETMAIIHAVEQDLESNETLEIRTDSDYAIKSLTEWCINWQKSNWKSSSGKEVQNKDLFERALRTIRKRKGKVVFTHVAGHKGIKGNEEADKLAVLGATLPLEK